MSMILHINFTEFSLENLSVNDPILLWGEPGTDGTIMKIGDGMTPWSQLESLPMPSKGAIPHGVDFRYVISVNDPLCGNKYDRSIIDVGQFSNIENV